MIKMHTKHLFDAIVDGGNVGGVCDGVGGTIDGGKVFAIEAAEAYLA